MKRKASQMFGEVIDPSQTRLTRELIKAAAVIAP
jgi:hypothetical protein